MPREMTQIEHAARIRRRFSSVRSHCHAAHAASEQRDKNQLNIDRLRQLQQSRPDVYGVESSETIASLLLVAGVFAVWGVDLVLLYPIIEFLMNPVLSHGALKNAVLIGFPALIVTLETDFSIQRRRAYLASLESGDPRTYQMWNVVTLLFAVVMPAGVVTTFFVANYGFPAWINTGIAVMLGCLSSAGHFFILFSGPTIVDAVSLLSFRRQLAAAETWVTREEQTRTAEAGAAAIHFEAASQDLTLYNRRFPNAPLEVGPFDAVSQRVLEIHYGYPVIQQNGQTPPPPQTPVRPAAPPSAARDETQPAAPLNGEAEYLRTVLAQRIRNDESEVRPETESH